MAGWRGECQFEFVASLFLMSFGSWAGTCVMPVKATGKHTTTKVTPKWSSPRFISPSHDNGGSPDSSSPATTSVSPARTPTQRELKKLEDYWTRHDPIQDDSPRLRSNRKAKFDVKECLSTNQKLTKKSPAVPQKGSIADLSESPIPFSGQNKDLKNFKVSPNPPKKGNQDEKVSKNASQNIFAKFAYAKYFDKNNLDPKGDKPAVVQETKPFHTNPVPRLLKSPAKSPDIRSLPASQGSELSDSYPPRSRAIDENCDSDSESYVPPRRKLRSEVSKDELWDGFPLKVSFKRLAPLSKQSDAMYFTSGDESSQDSIACQETEKVIIRTTIEQSEEKNMPGNLEVHDETSLESTIIYEDCDQEETVSPDTSSTAPESDGNIEHIHVTSLQNKCRDIDKPSTPTRRKKRKLELPDTPRKRSARLLEKSLVTTPERASGLSVLNDSPKSLPNTSSLSPLKRLNLKFTDKCETRDADVTPGNNTIKEDHGISNVINESAIEDVSFKEQTIIEDSSCTISQANKSATNTAPLSTASLNSETDQSISQILHVDCENIFVNDNDNMKDDDEHNIKDDSCSNEIIESVSEIVNHLLDVVESHGREFEKQIKYQASKDQSATERILESHPGERNSDMARPNDRALSAKQRRSSRLADLEKRFEYFKERAVKKEKELSDETLHGISEKDKESAENTLNQRVEPGNTVSLHPKQLPNLANKSKTTQKEGNKSVPPLRIKLKLPFTPKSHKKKSSVKSSHNLNKVSEDGAVNANEKSKSGDERRSSNKQKKKKSRKDNKKAVPEQPPNDTYGDNAAKPKKNGVGQKKGFPQEKAKKSKRYKKEAKRWSPAANVNLRLNTERRVAALGKLLGNPKLDKHACVLWSSENRRHVQLSNADASSEELDEILRRKWEGLSEREKTRYFQRARDAMRDENRHSTRRQLEEANVEEQAATGASGRQQSAHPDMARFLALDAEGQRTKLTQALHFYREVSPEEYNNVVKAYQASVEEEQKRRTGDVKKPKQKHNKNKSKKASSSTKSRGSKAPVVDTQAMCRKLLYEKVADNWIKIVGILEEKKRLQRQIISDNMARLAWRLVAGEEEVQFSEDTTSARLSQTLCDLKDLERARKLDVQGAEHAARRGQLDRLDSWFGDVDVDSEELNRLVSQISDEPLSDLDQQTLDDFIPDQDACLPFYHPIETQTETHRNVTSPTSILTDWVAGEMLASNQNAGRRGAVSLLSNKIISSSAFVVPQYVNFVYTSADSAGNRLTHDQNNNSDVMNCDRVDKNNNSVKMICDSVNSSNSVIKHSEAALSENPETTIYQPVKNVHHHGFRVKQQMPASDNV